MWNGWYVASLHLLSSFFFLGLSSWRLIYEMGKFDIVTIGIKCYFYFLFVTKPGGTKTYNLQNIYGREGEREREREDMRGLVIFPWNEE